MAIRVCKVICKKKVNNKSGYSSFYGTLFNGPIELYQCATVQKLFNNILCL